MSKTSKPFRCVIVESPFAGAVDRNLRYLRAAMRDCLRRGEAPFASHGLYTQPGVLDDNAADERALGIDAGFAWGEKADAVVVYTDLGCSHGMEQGIARASRARQPIEYRTLGADWDRPSTAGPSYEDARARVAAAREAHLRASRALADAREKGPPESVAAASAAASAARAELDQADVGFSRILAQLGLKRGV